MIYRTEKQTYAWILAVARQMIEHNLHVTAYTLAIESGVPYEVVCDMFPRVYQELRAEWF